VLASSVPITGSACEGVTCEGMIEIYCWMEMFLKSVVVNDFLFQIVA